MKKGMDILDNCLGGGIGINKARNVKLVKQRLKGIVSDPILEVCSIATICSCLLNSQGTSPCICA